MQEQRSKPAAAGGDVVQDDEEAAVLNVLLVRAPHQLTVAEVARELGEMDLDAVEVAIDELRGAGLAHRNGELVLPSRAAVRAAELMHMSGGVPIG